MPEVKHDASANLGHSPKFFLLHEIQQGIQKIVYNQPGLVQGPRFITF